MILHQYPKATGFWMANGRRKFVATDFDDEENWGLIDEAMQYVRNYTGTFEFLIKMRENSWKAGRLFPTQAAPVLNCMMAQHVVEMSQPQPKQKVIKPDMSPKPVAPVKPKDPNHGRTFKLPLRVPRGRYLMPNDSVLVVDEPEFGDYSIHDFEVSVIVDPARPRIGFAEVVRNKLWYKQNAIDPESYGPAKEALMQLLTAEHPGQWSKVYAETLGKCSKCNRVLEAESNSEGFCLACQNRK